MITDVDELVWFYVELVADGLVDMGFFFDVVEIADR